MSLPPAALSTTTAPPENSGWISKTISYYTAFIALGMVGASLGPTLPDLAQNTQVALSSISLLFTANSLGRIVGALQGGRLYDRIPGHPLLALTLIVMIATTALVPIIPLLWLLTLVIFIRGMAQGMIDVGGNTLLVWLHRDKVGPFLNGLHFAFGAGAFLAPLIIAQVVLISHTITWAYWTLALLMLPMMVWLLWLPSPAIRTISTASPSGQINYLLVGLIVLFFFLYGGVETGFGNWIFTYALTLKLADETMAAYLTAAFFGAFMVGRLLTIPIAIRFRPRTILLSDLLGGLLSLTVILLWPASPLVVWLGTIGMGLAMASIFPTLIALAERRMMITGWVTGWFLVGAGAGGMTLPWLIGQFFEKIGPSITMFALMLNLLLALGVLAALTSTRWQKES
jgi:fucose permease